MIISDEVLNLTTVMQYCGFQCVIGRRWTNLKMGPPVSRHLAKTFTSPFPRVKKRYISLLDNKRYLELKAPGLEKSNRLYTGDQHDRLVTVTP